MKRLWNPPTPNENIFAFKYLNSSEIYYNFTHKQILKFDWDKIIRTNQIYNIILYE